jgi:signal transduction histidine kinase
MDNLHELNQHHQRQKTPPIHNVKTTDKIARTEALRTRREKEFQSRRAREHKSINILARKMAHDFNNILAGILSSAELIKMDLTPENPGYEILDQIFLAGGRAREMIRQLRDFSQRKPAERALIPLPPAIEECLQMLRSIIPDKVEITHSIAQKCPAIFADAAQIHQAVMTLCLNAWNSLPERTGRINVRLDEFEISPDMAAQTGLRAGKHVRISIRDNGPGLRKNDLERVFEPFAFKRSSSKDCGLELFTVQEIAYENDGAVTVESAPDDNTVFHLFFPIPN